MKRFALAFVIALLPALLPAQQEGGGGEQTESCQIRSMIRCHAQCNPAQEACLGQNPTRIELCHNQYEWCYGVCMDTTWCGFPAF